MIVDSHTHVIASDHDRYPTSPLGGHQSTWSKDRPVDADGLLAAMDAAGIDKAVVVQASTVFGHDNSYVADTIDHHRDRFVGVFSVDVLAPTGLDDLKRWIDRGLSGLRLFTTGTTMPGQATWLDDPRSFPVWEYCETNGVPVCLQMTADGIPMLRTLLDHFPNVRVLLDHLARPKLDQGPPYSEAEPLFGLAGYPGVFLKMTNRTLESAAQGASTPRAFVDKVMASFGADRVAWGSNFPAATGTLGTLLGEAEAATAHLSQAERDAFFAGTVTALYPALRA